MSKNKLPPLDRPKKQAASETFDNSDETPVERPRVQDVQEGHERLHEQEHEDIHTH